MTPFTFTFHFPPLYLILVSMRHMLFIGTAVVAGLLLSCNRAAKSDAKNAQADEIRKVIDAKTPEEALRQFKLAVEANDTAPMRLNYAAALLQAQRYDDARAQYEVLLKRTPDDPKILADAGVCYYLMGKYEKARDYMQRAVKIDPNYSEAKQNLEIINKKLEESLPAKATNP